MTNDEIRIHERMPIAEPPPPSDERTFDLEMRTTKFGAAAIRFAKRIPANPITLPLITQLVRAATSIGANYAEANNSVSRKDFHHKIGICRKESKETIYWLRMVSIAEITLQDRAKPLAQEAKELNLIFSAIHRQRNTP
jgi:four helix bundle protein